MNKIMLQFYDIFYHYWIHSSVIIDIIINFQIFQWTSSWISIPTKYTLYIIYILLTSLSLLFCACIGECAALEAAASISWWQAFCVGPGPVTGENDICFGVTFHATRHRRLLFCTILNTTVGQEDRFCFGTYFSLEISMQGCFPSWMKRFWDAGGGD